MAPTKYSCPACNAPVVRKHLRQHLEKSLHLECQRYLHDQLTVELSSDDDTDTAGGTQSVNCAGRNRPSISSLHNGGQSHSQPRNTQDLEPANALQVDPLGDYFGDYAEMDDVERTTTEEAMHLVSCTS
jgi:hypothetical protein